MVSGSTFLFLEHSTDNIPFGKCNLSLQLLQYRACSYKKPSITVPSRIADIHSCKFVVGFANNHEHDRVEEVEPGREGVCITTRLPSIAPRQCLNCHFDSNLLAIPILDVAKIGILSNRVPAHPILYS